MRGKKNSHRGWKNTRHSSCSWQRPPTDHPLVVSSSVFLPQVRPLRQNQSGGRLRVDEYKWSDGGKGRAEELRKPG